MREIKFRAWNKTQLWMDNVWSIDWEHDLLCFSKHNQDFMEHYALMQFTGLKDKNGVEIYEEDIFNYRCGGTKQDSPYVVKDAFELWKDIGEGEGDSYYRMSDFEVIGNIYEHPHLLEGAAE